MSRLEDNRAKPALLPLLEPNPLWLSQAPLPRVLNTGTQADISTWAVKTALVVELLNPRTRMASDAQARQVKERHGPCDGAAVFIAYYGGGWLQLSYNHGASSNPPFSMTTIQLHRVLLQVFLWGGEEAVDLPTVSEGSWHQQIWPPTGAAIGWPSAHAVPPERMGEYLRGLLNRYPFESAAQKALDEYQARENHIASQPTPPPQPTVASQRPTPRQQRSRGSGRRDR